MADVTTQRTLVKSPPELWSEVSEVESLARHLGEFGDIRITKLEPEHTVAWEGEHASGTVALEASGWGTKVTLSVAIAETNAPSEVEPEPTGRALAEPEPTTAELTAIEFTSLQPASEAASPPAESAPEAPAASLPPMRPREGFFTRLFRRRRPALATSVTPEPATAAPEPPPARTGTAPPPAPAPPEPPPLAEEPVATGPNAIGEQRAREVLDGALDDLGAAHRRPFSRG